MNFAQIHTKKMLDMQEQAEAQSVPMMDNQMNQNPSPS
jgi:hypothetical protein